MSKTDEIAARLRLRAEDGWIMTTDDVLAILDERDRIKAALEPFACECKTFCSAFPIIQNPTEKCGFRRARAALEGKP